MRQIIPSLLLLLLLPYRWGGLSATQSKQHLYPIMMKGQYGFISKEGKLLFKLPLKAYNVSTFSEGLADIGLRTGDGISDFGFGFIDTGGKIVIPTEYNRVSPFAEGLAAVEVKEKKKWGFINRSGEMVVEPSLGFSLPFSSGLAAAQCSSDHPNRAYWDKYGYIDKSGNWIIKPQFVSASSFSEGVARIEVKDESKKLAKCAYINKEGAFVILPTEYSLCSSFSEGLAMVQVKFPLEKECSPGRQCGDGVRKVGYIDKTGKIVIEPQFDGVYDVIYTTSDVTEPLKYYSSGKERDFSEGLAAVRVEDRLWGYVDKQGQIVIKPQFVYAGQFKEGLAAVAVRKSGKRVYGFINQSGQFVIQPQYDDVKEFTHGLAMVAFQNSHGEVTKFGYIDKKGRYVWRPTL